MAVPRPTLWKGHRPLPSRSRFRCWRRRRQWRRRIMARHMKRSEPSASLRNHRRPKPYRCETASEMWSTGTKTWWFLVVFVVLDFSCVVCLETLKWNMLSGTFGGRLEQSLCTGPKFGSAGRKSNINLCRMNHDSDDIDSICCHCSICLFFANNIIYDMYLDDIQYRLTIHVSEYEYIANKIKIQLGTFMI